MTSALFPSSRFSAKYRAGRGSVAVREDSLVSNRASEEEEKGEEETRTKISVMHQTHSFFKRSPTPTTPRDSPSPRGGSIKEVPVSEQPDSCGPSSGVHQVVGKANSPSRSRTSTRSLKIKRPDQDNPIKRVQGQPSVSIVFNRASGGGWEVPDTNSVTNSVTTL